ncbi:probable N-acetyltransferase HLS1 [Rhodamnia argentea]|uniref:Probable N-acetyltransferase HLS1 n=1 Tax=Rhodamnia argentea TaxID=178133 RepID=A0ABM3GVG2_9MYRT|nr:probable N-acetyltransferase HLS1 [Rhodamnia argentea]
MATVVVREYDPEKDRAKVDAVERECEVGPSRELSLFTDHMGDPICRVRNCPAFLMLVAEMGEEKEMVGMIRGCIKTVTCGKRLSRNTKNATNNSSAAAAAASVDSYIPTKQVPVYTKVGYILGLRVPPPHRRMGIASKLVERMEEWVRESGGEYCYMATENDNLPSVNLFTSKCGYSKFRTPSILVNPVFAHRLRLPRRAAILKLCPRDAELLYRLRFSTSEFFPRDIDAVLNNKLSLGTFLAVPRGSDGDRPWGGATEFLVDPPESWAVVSVWNLQEVYKLEVRGVPAAKRALARASRAVDGALPWLGLPSFPELFRPFGAHFLYGLGGEGPRAGEMVRALCGHAHNLAKEHGCAVVATEVARREPLALAVPHWKRLSFDDLWCVKRLGQDYSDGAVGDWTKSPPGLSIFVDPREV